MHMHTHADRSNARPFAPRRDRAERAEGLRRVRPFARPSGLNWLQHALRMGEIDEGFNSGMGPFDLSGARR